MSVPRLHIIADRGACASDQAFLSIVAELTAILTPGELALHVRIKQGERLSLAQRARVVSRPLAALGVPVLLNGTLAEAQALGFDGVHWPQAHIPQEGVRSSLFRGASVHDEASLAAAARAGAHYVMFGPVWSPLSKEARPAGIAALAQLAAHTRLPVVAVGGVTADRVEECLRAGAYGVAVVSAVMQNPRRASAVAALRSKLNPRGELHVSPN